MVPGGDIRAVAFGKAAKSHRIGSTTVACDTIKRRWPLPILCRVSDLARCLTWVRFAHQSGPGLAERERRFKADAGSENGAPIS